MLTPLLFIFITVWSSLFIKLNNMEEITIKNNQITNLDTITRFEVINKNGRVYTIWDANKIISASLQDDGRTLKIFIKDK